MKVLRVFEVAFKEGCGINLDDVLASEQFHRAVKFEQGLFRRYPANTMKGIALRVGAFGMIDPLHVQRIEDVEVAARKMRRTRYSLKTRALIRILGEEIVKAARRVMPPEFRQCAVEWRTASSERQLEIADRLLAVLDPGGKKGNWLEDALSQPRSRVLPLRFSVEGEGYGPNCLGKAELLAGFALEAGFRTLAAAPLITWGDLYDVVSTGGARAVLADIQERKLAVSESLLTSLQRVVNASEAECFRAARFHLALIFKRGDRQELLVDPNYGLRCTLRHSVRSAYATRLRPLLNVVPGQCVILAAPSWQLQFDGSAQHLGKLLHVSREAEARFRASDGSEGAFLSALESSGALEELEQLMKPPPGYDKAASPVDRIKCFLSSYRQSLRDRGDFILMPADGLSLPDGYEGVLPLFHSLGLNEASKRLGAINAKRSIYPVTELSESHFSIACGVLQHVGVDMGLAEATEAMLCQHSVSRFRLLYAAGVPLRTGYWPRRSLQAVQLLWKSGVIHSSVKRVLDALTELVSKPIELEGDDDGYRPREVRESQGVAAEWSAAG